MSTDLKQSAKCELCDKQFEAKNAAVLARAIGVHKRIAHGIQSSRKNYYVKVADRKKVQYELDNPVACPWCDMRTKNRSGMSSHIKTNHPIHFNDWTATSVHSSSRIKQLREEGILPSQKSKEAHNAKHRKYQRQWYADRKLRMEREAGQREAAEQLDRKVAGLLDEPAQNGRPPLRDEAVNPSNMTVSICPRCHCRFGTLIIEG